MGLRRRSMGLEHNATEEWASRSELRVMILILTRQHDERPDGLAAAVDGGSSLTPRRNGRAGLNFESWYRFSREREAAR